jgi:hypothetical protein
MHIIKKEREKTKKYEDIHMFIHEETFEMERI